MHKDTHCPSHMHTWVDRYALHSGGSGRRVWEQEMKTSTVFPLHRLEKCSHWRVRIFWMLDCTLDICNNVTWAKEICEPCSFILQYTTRDLHMSSADENHVKRVELLVHNLWNVTVFGSFLHLPFQPRCGGENSISIFLRSSAAWGDAVKKGFFIAAQLLNCYNLALCNVLIFLWWHSQKDHAQISKIFVWSHWDSKERGFILLPSRTAALLLLDGSLLQYSRMK